MWCGVEARSAGELIEAQRGTLALADGLAGAVGEEPPLVNLGGGFGIPYFAGEQPLDVEAIGRALDEALEPVPPSLASSASAIELGRWLVGEAGVYLTRVVERKASHSQTFRVTDGGMNQQLAPSGNLGQVVRHHTAAPIPKSMDE